MNIEQMKGLVSGAGIVGAGGAGFPLEFKLRDDVLDTLIINAAECEPLVYTDFTILKYHMDTVLAGARAIMEAANIKQGFLAMKEYTAAKLSLHDGQEVAERIHVRELPDVYPMGDEIILIYQVTGRVVQPGALPFTEGVLVSNTETLYNVQEAIGGNAVTKKWLSVAGNIPNRAVVQAPVGMVLADLFAELGVKVPEGHVVIDGGPAMGKVVDCHTSVVTKTTKAVLILPEDIPAVQSKTMTPQNVLKRASSVCCQCSVCTEMCPRALVGYPIRPDRTVRSVANYRTEHPEDYLTASLCSMCGVCELMACCQGISPLGVMKDIKKSLSAHKLKYVHQGPRVHADPDRDYRLLPVQRFKSRIGVLGFDKRPEYLEDFSVNPKQIVLPLSQHAGKPAVPAVKPGDKVEAGSLAAHAAEGISANIHVPVDGRVVLVDEKKIVIACKEGLG